MPQTRLYYYKLIHIDEMTVRDVIKRGGPG